MYGEMQIKLQLGKLKLKLPLESLIESQQRQNDLQILSISLEHVLGLSSLPPYHKDPFDRLLVVQTNVEKAVLMTRDKAFLNYPVKLIW